MCVNCFEHMYPIKCPFCKIQYVRNHELEILIYRKNIPNDTSETTYSHHDDLNIDIKYYLLSILNAL